MTNLLGYYVRAYNESGKLIDEWDFLNKDEADQWFALLSDDSVPHHVEFWEIYDNYGELLMETDKYCPDKGVN